MGKGISIEFVADVGKFIGRTKDVERALDDTADALDDLGRDAAKSGDKMGDELKDGAKKAEGATDKLERKFKDTFDEVKRGSRKAGDDIGDNVKRGTREAESGMDSFKDEAKQTARETAASFDGSAESVADSFQEIAANALGGFGPAGAAAGVALALGLGAFLSQWQKDTEAAKELTAGMYDDMLASGQRYVSAQFVNQRVGEIVKDDNLTRMYSEAARTIGVDVTTAIAAAAGQQDAMNTVTAAAAAWQREYGAEAGSTNVAVSALTGAIDTQQTSMESASSKAALAAGAMQTTGEAARAYDQALAGVNDSLADTVKKIGENNAAYSDGATRAQENREALAGLGDELSGVSEAAVAAGVTGAGLAKVQADQYAAFLQAAEAAGITGDAARDLADEYGLLPVAVNTAISTTGAGQAQTDAERTRAALALIQDRQVKIGVTLPDLPSLQFQVDRLASGVRAPVIGVNFRSGQLVQ